MQHLQFFSVSKIGYDGNDIVHIPENMEFPPRLRSLRSIANPRKIISLTLSFEYLVELDMQQNRLKMLWQAAYKSLEDFFVKFMVFEGTSNATNLEGLDVRVLARI